MRIATFNRCIIYLFFVLSCTEDDSALSPAYMAAVTPLNDNIFISEGPYFVSVRVVNKDGNPLPEIEVKFKLTTGDAELIETQSNTDANGIAYTYIKAKVSKAPIVLEASVAGLSDKLLFNYGVSRSRTSQIIITSGNNQDVGAGLPATNPLKVKVMDDLGTVAVSASVKFVVLNGNGQVSSETVKTDQSGEASTGFIGSNTTIANKIAAIAGKDSVFFNLESLYISALSMESTIQGVQVKWSQNKATQFQKYSLLRVGPDGVYKFLAEFKNVSDTSYYDTDPALSVNTLYMYKIRVHTPTSTIDNEVGLVFGKTIQLQSIAIDFEVDEARNQIYVSLPELNQIHIYDLTTHVLKNKITVGSKPHGISISHDGSTLYIALYGSGSVAFLNLNTLQVTKLNVSEELGDLRVFDILEGAPGRVFVTGSPESNGIAFMLVIKTDENNKVERFMKNVIRFKPALAADYGKYIYVIDHAQLYKLDPYGTYTDPSQEADYRFNSPRQFLLINPTGTRLYLDFEALNTSPVSLAGLIGANVPALSPDGSVVHYHASTIIRSYNTTTLQKIKETGFYVNALRKLQLTSDNSTFIALGVYYSAPGDLIYFIPNR